MKKKTHTHTQTDWKIRNERIHAEDLFVIFFLFIQIELIHVYKNYETTRERERKKQHQHGVCSTTGVISLFGFT